MHVPIKVCAIWVISCVTACVFYGITCCVISFLFWNWIFTFAAYHKINFLSRMFPDWLGGLPRVKGFSRFGWQPSLLISLKLQWFTAMYYLQLPRCLGALSMAQACSLPYLSENKTCVQRLETSNQTTVSGGLILNSHRHSKSSSKARVYW